MSPLSSTSATVAPVDPVLARRLDAIVRKLQDLEEERDQLILRAREEGASLREIAEHGGMTHVGIKKLIGRHLHPGRPVWTCSVTTTSRENTTRREGI
jgi:DNA-directed RNA polymerase specialized sigma24 family protein